MSFKDIVGQEKVIKILKKSVKENRISSSYIFVGNKGVGKKLTALEFYKAMNCLNINKNNEACDNCEVCSKINGQYCPDLKIIKPIKDLIKIEQIRELRKNIEIKPFENKKEIYIIDQAEQMTLEASNCLLKTIEEPPDYAVIILICLKLDPLLLTIISRCQLLNKINNLKEERAELISKLAQGSIGKAFSLLSDNEYFNQREKLLEHLSTIFPGKYDPHIFINIEKMITEIDRMEEILEIIISWYRDILMIKRLGIQKNIINSDRLEVISEISRNYPLKILIDILDYSEQIQEYLKKNVNKQLVLERLYLKMAGIEYCLK
jgi:DNA polymerase-3 subunit delta'